MKLYFSILALFLFVSCAPQPAADNTVNESVKEKNRQTALINEVTKITRLAQTIEQQGRDMQLFRETTGAESKRQCSVILDENLKQTADLETRIKNLPEDYSKKLAPITGEINECLSCTRNTLENCKKARATINQVIKEIFP